MTAIHARLDFLRARLPPPFRSGPPALEPSPLDVVAIEKGPFGIRTESDQIAGRLLLERIASRRDGVDLSRVQHALATRDRSALQVEVDKCAWYHTLELPFGIVTPGEYDHRPLVPWYGIPHVLSGKRVLDVATSNGFWAFEFERRGAGVTALDIDRLSDLDLPVGLRRTVAPELLGSVINEPFEIAKLCFDARVERVCSSVYDLNPTDFGTFDMVHTGDLLIHLRNPVEALRRIRSVTRSFALISEVIHTEVPLDQWTEYLGSDGPVSWMRPSLPALIDLVLAAGFSQVALVTTYQLLERGKEYGPWRAVLLGWP